MPAMITAVVKITVPCRRGMSRPLMASTVRRPIPGILNRVSVITAPDSRLEIWIAIMVITGSREFFRAWPRITGRGARPLALAVLI